MNVGNGLAGGSADIDANVVTVRFQGLSQFGLCEADEIERSLPLLGGQKKEIGDVAKGDNQQVAVV